MDAYTTYILQMANSRAEELRRDARQYALARAARGARTAPWAGIRQRFARRPRPTAEPVTPVPLPRPAAERELRRTA